MFERRLVGGIAAVLMMVSSGAGIASAQQKATYTAVFSSDSLELLSPTLSPNGKWVAFVAGSHGKHWLMIIPSAGGMPVAITSDGYDDAQPVWFPGSDRIVFRTSRVTGALMTVRIDTARGRPIGGPQRLTIEPTQRFSFAVSPDGREVAYATMPAKGPAQLKVLPALGGAARTVATIPEGGIPQMYWTAPDSLTYSHVSAPLPSNHFTSWYQSPRGGSPTLIEASDENTGFTLLAPNYILRGSHVRIGGDTLGTLSLVNWKADTVLRFDTRMSHANAGINAHIRPSADGRSVMLMSTVGRGGVRMLSIEGGSPRDLTPLQVGGDDISGYPYGFSPDGRSVYLHFGGASHRLAITPVDGGEARSIPLPANAQWPNPTSTGRYFYTWTGHPADSVHGLYVVDAGTGHSELVSSSAAEVASAEEMNDDLYYGEYRGGVFEIRRWSPGKGSTLVQTAPSLPYQQRFHNALAVAPGGKTYASTRVQGDSTHFLIGDSTGTREVMAIRGRPRGYHWSRAGHVLAAQVREPAGKDSICVIYVAAFDEQMRQLGPARAVARGDAGANFTDPVWSYDGRTMAVAVEHTRAPDAQVGVLFFPLNDKTGVLGAPRRVDIPHPATEWDDIGWTRDDRNLLLLTYSSSANRSMLWRVPRDGASAPYNIAAQETNLFWDFVRSPDGKRVAYPAELPDRNTIWRVDLPRTR